MKKYLGLLSKIIMIAALMIFTTSCSLISDISNNLIELDVTYDNLDPRSLKMQNGDIVYTSIREEMAYDTSENTIYYDDVLIAYTYGTLSAKEVKDIVQTVNGELVGNISGCINALQIKVRKSQLVDLNDMADKLMDNKNVMFAGYEYPIFASDFSDSTTEIKSSSLIIPWWQIEIEAERAWQYSNLSSPINIGIIDNGFDVEHNDLKGQISFLSNYSKNTAENHGTHVSGIIGALNNNVGLRGVADGATLICADYSSEEGDNLLSTGEYIEIIKAMIESDAKVINNSWGNYFLSEDTIMKRTYVDKADYVREHDWLIEYFNGVYESYLKYIEVFTKRSALECALLINQLILSEHNDFIIIQAAGNGLDNRGEIATDAKNCGFFNSLSSGVYSEWEENIEGILDYEQIKDHIVIVGATDDTHNIASFSNFGEIVDICAPGKDIYSTLTNNDYGELSGTSMAAPIVTGSIAYIWSLNPKLTVHEIKNIICTQTNRFVNGGLNNEYRYPVINLGMASEFVYKEINSDKKTLETDKTDYHIKMYAPDFYDFTVQDVISIYGESNCEQVKLTHEGTGLYVSELKYTFSPQQIGEDLVGSSKIQAIEITDGGEILQGVIIGDLISDSIASSNGKIDESNIGISDVNGNYILYRALDGIDIYIELNEAPILSDDTLHSHLITMRSYSGLVKFSYDTKQQSQENEDTASARLSTDTTQASATTGQEIQVDEEWVEYARSQVTNHYKEESGSSGEFVCFPDEDIIEKGFVKFILRYSLSREECDEIIANGGLYSANVYQSQIEIEVNLGKVTDESGNVWYLNDSSGSKSVVDVQSEVNLLSDFIDVAARYDNLYINSSDSDKWNVMNMLAYYKNLTYVEDITLRQWLKVIYNEETLPSLNDTLPSIKRNNAGYEFVFGDPQELDVEYDNIINAPDGTISVMCNVYTPFQTNTKNECEYGLLKKCEVILVPDNNLIGTEKYRIKDVKRISSYMYSGSCGENVMYAIDDNNVTYIYGNGRMYDYSFTTASGIRSNSPFSEVVDTTVNFPKIIIEEGVTYIGTCTFPADCSVTEIYFPKSVIKIGDEVIRTFQGTTDVWDAGLSISNNYMIYCYKDSYVYQYAVEHNMKYVLR